MKKAQILPLVYEPVLLIFYPYENMYFKCDNIL